MEYWEAISDAISKLRERKNRPDLDNIFTLLSRKRLKLSKAALEDALIELEKENKLFRKSFKGHISYRQTVPGEKAAASFSSDTEEDTQDTTEAFGRPVANEGKTEKHTGLFSEDGENQREMSTKPETTASRPNSAVSSDSDSQEATSKKRKFSTDVNSGPVARMSGRKRTKKIHGPDWQTDVPQLECKMHLSTCVICKSKDISTNLLFCSACKIYVHARCLQLTDRSIAKISANKQFYCLGCKPCKICHWEASVEIPLKERSKTTLASIMAGNDIIHCCQCYSVFHLSCLRPPLDTKPRDQPWMCRKCNYEVNKKEKLKANAAANAMLLVSQQKPLSNPERSDSSKASRSSSCSPVSNNENSLGNNGTSLSTAASPEPTLIKSEAGVDTSDKKEAVIVTENNNSKNATDNNAPIAQSTKSKNTEQKTTSELRRKLLEILPPRNRREISPAIPQAAEENKIAEHKKSKIPKIVAEAQKPQQQSNKLSTQVAPQNAKDKTNNGVSLAAKKSSIVPPPEPSLVLTAAEPITNGQAAILGQVLIPIPLAARPKSPPLLVTKKGFAQFQIDYPFVGDWTSEQVANFFKALGYDKEAPVFVEQEIDGRSLLLLGRSDVLNGLGLKLGPAVKIFKHISNLQDIVRIN
ncbi:uncharacterized protein LOC100898089 [Galendromus occidentalis]|uniref:Uncharacterized protein LOC100898089 n=1 Tax=Galendromus occidentalis TaxID=34638 RepID=A0AAJ6QYF7_9ACAR|nr:uncharacterized protein LOC100898089 [Galendromus occidentalis]